MPIRTKPLKGINGPTIYSREEIERRWAQIITLILRDPGPQSSSVSHQPDDLPEIDRSEGHQIAKPSR